MKKALQESMRNLNRFYLESTQILDAFSAYFGRQRASKINENSGRGLERPLEASGVAFGKPLGRIWRLWRRQLAKKIKVLRNARGPSLSRDLDRVRQTNSVTPCSPEGRRRISPLALRIPPGRPQICGPYPFLTSKIASKISLDF